MAKKPDKRHNTRNYSSHPLVRSPVKSYWRPLSLQAIASPDRFVRVVNGILSGALTVFPDFNS